MRKVSLEKVPTAILSRQTAGIRGQSLIINLPGQPKAIRECLDAVMPAVPYCIDLIGGPFLVTTDRVKAFRPKRVDHGADSLAPRPWHHPVPKCFAQARGSIEVDPMSQQQRQFLFEFKESQSEPRAWKEFHEDVDIARRREIGTQDRTEQ